MEDKIYNIDNIYSGLFSYHQLINLKFTSSELIIANAEKNKGTQIDSIYFKEKYIYIKYEEEEFILKLISEKGKKFIIKTDKKNLVNEIINDINLYKSKYILNNYLSVQYKLLEKEGISNKISFSSEIEFSIYLLIPRLINDISDSLKDFKLKIDKETNLYKHFINIYYKIFAAITEINIKMNKLGNIYKKYFDQIKEKNNLNDKKFDFDNDEEENKENENEDIISESTKEFKKQFYKLQSNKSTDILEKKKIPKKKPLKLNKSTDCILNNSSLERDSISYQLTTKPEFSEKLIAKISNPMNVQLNIIFNEPLTILQRSCEKFFYKEFYKNNISLIENDEYKLLYIIQFLINDLSLNLKRFLIPIQPIVNETYEYEDKNLGFKFFSEQVEENISAYICELPNMKYYSNNYGYWKYNLINKTLEFQDREIRRIELKCKNEIIKFAFNYPILQFKNLMIGNPYFDYRGIVKIYIIKENNNQNQSFAEINFSIKHQIKGNFEGKIFDKNQNVTFILNGNIYDKLYITNVKNSKKTILWELNKNEKYLKNKLGHYNEHKYYLPYFSYNLNNDNIEIMKNILPTDSRYRKDIREYEKGNILNANSNHKIIINSNKKESKPIYFEKVSDIYGPYYKYKGNYWENKK